MDTRKDVKKYLDRFGGEEAIDRRRLIFYSAHDVGFASSLVQGLKEEFPSFGENLEKFKSEKEVVQLFGESMGGLLGTLDMDHECYAAAFMDRYIIVNPEKCEALETLYKTVETEGREEIFSAWAKGVQLLAIPPDASPYENLPSYYNLFHDRYSVISHMLVENHVNRFWESSNLEVPKVKINSNFFEFPLEKIQILSQQVAGFAVNKTTAYDDYAIDSLGTDIEDYRTLLSIPELKEVIIDNLKDFINTHRETIIDFFDRLPQRLEKEKILREAEKKEYEKEKESTRKKQYLEFNQYLNEKTGFSVGFNTFVSLPTWFFNDSYGAVDRWVRYQTDTDKRYKRRENNINNFLNYLDYHLSSDIIINSMIEDEKEQYRIQAKVAFITKRSNEWKRAACDNLANCPASKVPEKIIDAARAEWEIIKES